MKIHGTAKGGALSKKDFGVAFGGGAVCSNTTVYEVETSDDDTNFDANYERIGLQYVGSTDLGLLSTAKFYLKKAGNPTGNITCQYYQNSLTSTETASETVDASTVGSSYAAYTFNFAEENQIGQNDIIAVVWTDGGTTNKIRVANDAGLATTDFKTANRDTRYAGWTFSASDSVKATIVSCE